MSFLDGKRSPPHSSSSSSSSPPSSSSSSSSSSSWLPFSCLRFASILPPFLSSSSLYSDIRPHHIVLLYTALSYASTTTWYRRVSDRIVASLSRVTDKLIPLVYKGYVPDFMIRFGIRLRLRDQLLSLATAATGTGAEGKGGGGFVVEREQENKMRIVSELCSDKTDIAICTNAANEQHYEVPAAFYDLCLGPHKKYSSGLWRTASTTLEQSEEDMLALCCERAGVVDGMRVVDLGCGWGSLTLYLAAKFPRCKVTSISNSHSQREYILRTAQERGYNVDNIDVITCNIADDKGALDVVTGNDLVMSIEMFEHMKNYSKLLEKIQRFLKPKSGKLFVHIFSHKRFAYHFTDGWLAQNFFTGGTMPSNDLLLYFAQHFVCMEHWCVNGTHYERTSNAWLRMLDNSWANGTLYPVLTDAYGKGKEREWYVNWRLFFMSCAELWGYDSGEEWIVSHYLFEKR